MNRYLQIERALAKYKERPRSLDVNLVDASFRAGVEWADTHPIRYENIPVFGKKTLAEELKIFERLISCRGIFNDYFGNDARQISRNLIDSKPLDSGTSFTKINKQII